MVNNLKRWEGKVAIVTGASAGIGAAIAEQLVDVGVFVVGLARRKDRVQALADKLQNKKGKLYAVEADLTKEKDIIEAFEWTKKTLGPIHILINNAGCMKIGTLTDGETEVWKQTLDLNVLGLCIATREAIKDMQMNNVDGHVVHINSTAGHYVPPLTQINVYPATKFAVTALTESLRHELNSLDSKIKITSVSPGYVKTEMMEASTANISDPKILILKEYIKTQPGLNAEDVADAVMYVLGTPPHVQIHELIVRPQGYRYPQ